MDNKVFISLSIEELQNLISEAVAKEFAQKKEKPLMNFKETCSFLGISPSCLNKWKSENKIPYMKKGKRVFFDRSEVLSAIKKDDLYYKTKELEI